MKSRLLLACILLLSARCFSLDREAFTPTSYDLQAEVDPDQHRLAVRGKITIRNDSQTPQKIAVLQISSSLSWHSIKSGDTPLQFVSQPYTSDIDHTGALSEAIVTLPQAVAPKGTIELEIGYEGVIVLDATRLTRIGTPEAQANSSDWDQISATFTAVRGAGSVAWYPIATESANLSEQNSLFDVLGRWKTRAAGSTMHFQIAMYAHDGEPLPELLVNQESCQLTNEAMGPALKLSADCTHQPLGFLAPTFVMAHYQDLERPAIEVHYLRGHDKLAENYANTAETMVPFITGWFGPLRTKMKIGDLPEANTPFESGPFLFRPLTTTAAQLIELDSAHQLAHAAFSSPRPWINEGLAHFAQALYLENEKGRRSALQYMARHGFALSEAEKTTTVPHSDDEVNRSLLNTSNEDFYRTKAMYVWWMLRDMLGDAALKKVIAAYRPEEDKDASYLLRLIQSQSQHNLDWFFDDWVNRDRGLPSFRVASAFARKTAANAYLLTVTVENTRTCGAEVPIAIRFAGGELTRRAEVRAKSSAVVRVEVPSQPQEVIVNDGSVPESNDGAKPFKITSVADDK